jgi:hypothetical protein
MFFKKLPSRYQKTQISNELKISQKVFLGNVVNKKVKKICSFPILLVIKL